MKKFLFVVLVAAGAALLLFSCNSQCSCSYNYTNENNNRVLDERPDDYGVSNCKELTSKLQVKADVDNIDVTVKCE